MGVYCFFRPQPLFQHSCTYPKTAALVIVFEGPIACTGFGHILEIHDRSFLDWSSHVLAVAQLGCRKCTLSATLFSAIKLYHTVGIVVQTGAFQAEDVRCEGELMVG